MCHSGQVTRGGASHKGVSSTTCAKNIEIQLDLLFSLLRGKECMPLCFLLPHQYLKSNCIKATILLSVRLSIYSSAIFVF